MQRARFAAIALATALATGCGGGGGGSVTQPGNLLAAPSTPAAASTPAAPQSAQVAFRIVIPQATTTAQSRNPAYVSASTQSASVTVAPAGGSAGAPTVVSCTTVCQGSVNAAVGSDTFTINLYSGQNAGGSVLSTGSLTQTIVAATTNNVNVTFNGVPASIAMSGIPAGTLGTAFGAPQAFAVAVKDAGGNTIVGTYASAIHLTNSDTSGATNVVTSGSDTPPANTLLSSSDVAALNFTGASIVSATISATASALGSSTATFSPAPLLTSLSSRTGLIGTAVTETLTGVFIPSATTLNVGSGLTVSDLSIGATSITATFFVDPEASVGARSVSVQTVGGGASGNQTFTVSNTGVDVVTRTTDSTLGTTPGACPAGTSGDLRYALCHASAGDTIVFDTTAMCAGSTPCTITLGAPLPPIAQAQTVDGGIFGRVVIDGASAFRAFFVDTGTVGIANMQIQNALAHGGNGGDGSGGGGLGAGGGLFVNQALAAVTVSGVYFQNCGVAGGAGNTGPAGTSSGGGGGLDFAGGVWQGAQGSAGGGGVLGAGGNPVNGGNDGGNGGAGGGGGGSGVAAGTGGSAYATSAAGANGISNISGNGAAGGAGGFGGGGGGGEAASTTGGTGGAGGFGGGGGGGGVGDSGGTPGGTGGNGGPGGGGGGGGIAEAGTAGTGGAGGALATLHGGSGGVATSSNGGNGGGGAAAGPAIFVNAGSVTTTNSGATGSSAIAGSGGGAPATGGTADATPVFNFAGHVNSSGTPGPISGALSTTVPTTAQQRVSGPGISARGL